MPKGRGFLGCSQRTRHAHPKVKRCDRLTRALGTWLSPPLHRRTFPQALRYCTQSTTRRARVPFIPRTEVRGLLTEKDKRLGSLLWRRRSCHHSITMGCNTRCIRHVKHNTPRTCKRTPLCSERSRGRPTR